MFFFVFFSTSLAIAANTASSQSDQTPLIVVIITSVLGTLVSVYSAFSSNAREEKKLTSTLQGELSDRLQKVIDKLESQNDKLVGETDRLREDLFEREDQLGILQAANNDLRHKVLELELEVKRISNRYTDGR